MFKNECENLIQTYMFKYETYMFEIFKNKV